MLRDRCWPIIVGMGAPDEYTVLCEEIRTLLETPVATPQVERLENRLTDGYALALALEAERWRLERRIGELGAGVGQGDERPGAEIATLAARLSHASGRLDSLRSLLVALRRHVESARTSQIPRSAAAS